MALPKILLIEDDDVVFEYFNILLSGKCELLYSQDGSDFMDYIKGHSLSAVFVDLNLPQITGQHIIKKIREYDEDLPIVVVSSTDRIGDAIDCFRMGIVDFLKKPFDDNHLKAAFEACLKQKDLIKTTRNVRVDQGKINSDIIKGNNASLISLKEEIKQLTDSNIDVLILGESGAGKELIAKTLWAQENDPKRPYVTLNCSAIPKELIESVLFGHEKGSFTGAVKKQLGKFELADGGDIFLDEIGTLPMDLQAKLLRVLQEREIEPIGLGITKKLDFRVITATNEDLVQMVKDKEFRKDLYYRMNKMILKLPPLRDRKDDIATLVEFFLEKHSRAGVVKKVSTGAIKLLEEHSWPGNVRELENVIENLVITTKNETIEEENIRRFNFLQDPFDELSNETMANSGTTSGFTIDLSTGLTLDSAVRDLEKAMISKALDASDSKFDAARKLGIDRKTLSRKLKLYELED